MKSTLLTGILLGLALAGRTTAINLPVYNTNDSGAGSLRQCIADNATLGGGNTIIFSNVVTGTITLTNGELLIINNVIILGPGANVLAVNGNAAGSVFHITNGVTTTISGLTITNGSASGPSGGGILNEYSTLIVSNCTLGGNSASYAGGGIYNEGSGGSATLTIIASTFSGNSTDYGAGISNEGYGGNGIVTITASTFSGNSANEEGGGIYSDGQYGNATLSVVTSTFNSNSANYGGGIYNHTCAPGNATLTVVASTFSGNSASHGGGILNDAYSCPDISSASMSNSTIAAHNTGGGVHANSSSPTGATLEIGDTILNAGAMGENITNLAGTVTSDGYNLSSDNGGGFLTATGDQTSTNAKLGPLANNGGPTQTMALRVGSPAIDQGKSFGVTTDQRGQPRIYINPNSTLPPGGDGADIGAYEVSELRITAAQRTTNYLQLGFTSWLGTNYEVQSRSNMTIGS